MKSVKPIGIRLGFLKYWNLQLVPLQFRIIFNKILALSILIEQGVMNFFKFYYYFLKKQLLYKNLKKKQKLFYFGLLYNILYKNSSFSKLINLTLIAFRLKNFYKLCVQQIPIIKLNVKKFGYLKFLLVAKSFFLHYNVIINNNKIFLIINYISLLRRYKLYIINTFLIYKRSYIKRFLERLFYRFYNFYFKKKKKKKKKKKQKKHPVSFYSFEKKFKIILYYLFKITKQKNSKFYKTLLLSLISIYTVLKSRYFKRLRIVRKSFYKRRNILQKRNKLIKLNFTLKKKKISLNRVFMKIKNRNKYNFKNYSSLLKVFFHNTRIKNVLHIDKLKRKKQKLKLKKKFYRLTFQKDTLPFIKFFKKYATKKNNFSTLKFFNNKNKKYFLKNLKKFNTLFFLKIKFFFEKFLSSLIKLPLIIFLINFYKYYKISKELPYILSLYKILPRYKYKLLFKRYAYFFDLLNILFLSICLKKIKLFGYYVTLMLEKTKRHHFILNNIKSMCYIFFIIYKKYYIGIKLLIRGKFNGKTRRNKRFIFISKKSSIQKFSVSLDYFYKELHTFTGSFGIHIWFFFNN